MNSTNKQDYYLKKLYVIPTIYVVVVSIALTNLVISQPNVEALSTAIFAILISFVILFLAGINPILAEMNKTTKHLYQLANRDQLTSLYNRYALLEHYNDIKRNPVPTTIAIIDVDHFKSINDRFGHLVGDDVLKHIARTIEHNLRNDNCYRIGGEEFAVLYLKASLEQARRLSETLREQISSSNTSELGIENHRITCSIGIADVNPEQPIEIAMTKADKALYAAKVSGRNRVLCYEEQSD